MEKYSKLTLLMTLLCLLGVSPGHAASDEYIGDTAIYTGESTSLRPNILIIVDNSNAAANTAGSGEPYDASTDYTPAGGGYGRYDIWKAGQQGEFTQLELSNTTVSLENLTCTSNSNVIRTTLLRSGTYTGRGTADYPSIKNAGCDDRKAYSYALGNYLNYLNAPATASATALSQAQIVYSAIASVIDGSRFAANYGAMVYKETGNKGGLVVSEVGDLTDDAAFATFLSKLPGSGSALEPDFLSSNTARPQAEALLDAGYYFRGEDLPVGGQSAMTSPISNWCDKNYVILITNGLSNKDDDTALADIVGDYDHDGAEATAYGLGTHYLDDVAKYLYETDAIPDAGLLPSGVSRPLDGVQRIKTSTILAFQNDDELVRRAGQIATLGGTHGRGGYYNVFNANELAKALSELISNIVAEADTAFVAPVVPASTTNRTVSSNRVYLGLFKPQTQKPWLGNLKKYKVSNQNYLIGVDGNPVTDSNGDFIVTSRSFWGTDSSGNIMSSEGPRLSSAGDGGIIAAGGAGGTLLARNLSTDPRKIYTYLGSNLDLTDASNAFNATNITSANTGIADATQLSNLINYLHGWDAFDDDEDGTTAEKRPWILGDILHSKPLVFSYSSYADNMESTCFKDNAAGNSSMIYVGANDGMLHAFRDCDGAEEWAFVPDVLLPKLKNLQNVAHSYYVDSPPTAYIHDKNNDGNISLTDDKVILFFGLRRGAGDNFLLSANARGAYYALDVTDYDAPKLLWKFDASSFSELGETWSQPRLTKMLIGGDIKLVMWVGAGYDNNEDLRYGSVQTFPGSTSDTTQTSQLSTDSGAAVSGGGSAQHNPRGRGLVAIEVAQLDQVSGQYVPDFSNSGTVLWSYTNATDSAMAYSIPSNLRVLDVNADGFQDRIYVGDTGGRMWRFDIGDSNIANWGGKIIFSANPGTELTPSTGRKIFYKPSARIDHNQVVLYFGTGDRTHPLNTAVVDRMYAVVDKGQGTIDAIGEDDLIDMTQNALQDDSTSQADVDSILASLNAANNYGWLVKLNQHVGEKVLAESELFNQTVFFTTFAPNTGVTPDPCSPGNLGISRLYQMDYDTAEAVYNYDLANDNQSVAGNDRATNEHNEVLRRSDRLKVIGVGIPSGIVTMVDASGKVTMMVSSSNKVGTYSAPDSKLISPVYWMTW